MSGEDVTDAIDDLKGRVIWLEKIVFLLVDVQRNELLRSGRLDQDDKSRLAQFYDRLRHDGF